MLPELGLPAWFSYSIEEDATRAGQPLQDAYAVLAGSTSIVATGVNCSGRATCPDLGETWDSSTHTWSGDASFNTALATSWVAAGSRLVGGCARVGADHIAQLAGVLKGQPS